LVQHSLAGRVVWMSLAREDKLYRTVRIVYHRRQPFDIRQNQVGSLISREVARESNCQRIRTEDTPQPLDRFHGFVSPLGLFHRAAACEVEQPALENQMRLPEFRIFYAVDAFPRIGLPASCLPTGCQMTVV